jgi:hypothetical protein
MKKLLCSLLAVPGLLLAQETLPPPAAPVPKLTDEQMASIMKQLDQIESQITKNRGDSLGTALAKFRAAMNSDKDALDLYLACYKLENFDRKDLKQTDFQEWKDRNEERLKDQEFLTALRLQLEYLVLSIQAQDIEDKGPLIPALQAYIPKAVAAVQATMKHTASGAITEKDDDNNGNGRNRRPGGGGPGQGQGQLMGMLRQSVKATEFSRAYQLDDFLKLEEWEYDPMNLQGIYMKIIFPYYLENKPADLAAQWDAKINTELVLRKSVQSETEYQVFYKENYPPMLWAKASYLLENNVNPIMALADMLMIVRDNPTHPNAVAWLKQLREAVNGSQPDKISPSLTPPAAPDATVPPSGT